MCSVNARLSLSGQHLALMENATVLTLVASFLIKILLPFSFFFVPRLLRLSPPASSIHMVCGCRLRRAMRGLALDLVFLCRSEGHVFLKSRQTREYRFPLQPGLINLSLCFSTHTTLYFTLQKSFESTVKMHCIMHVQDRNVPYLP